MIADIVYFSSLVLSITLASHYRQIDDVEIKRNYGAGLGLLMACLICSFQVYHTVLMMWGKEYKLATDRLIIGVADLHVVVIAFHQVKKKFTGRNKTLYNDWIFLPAIMAALELSLHCCDVTTTYRHIHQLSIAYTWAYLMYLHYNNVSRYAIWLHQVLALRLVGLAFELHNADKIKKNMKVVGDIDVLSTEPSTVEIVAYTYFFIGLLKGPYYRWKVFHDHFTTPFGTLGDCRVVTAQKVKKAGICAVMYLLLWLKYSPDIYYDDKFYKYYGTDFRFLYNISQMLMYFLRCQILMLLCTAVCTEAGFGIYPAKCAAIPGLGPSEQLSLEKLAADTPNLALQEYNFAMLKCFENEKLLIGPRMKDTLRSWNMPTRYWFWANVYKNLTKCNREVKSACSFLAWTVWSSPSLQQIILSSTLWVYVHLEAEYNELYNTSDEMKLPWDIGFSIMRILCLIYLTPCLVISDVDVFLKYYNSIYWMFHLVLLGLIVGTLLLQKTGLFNYTYNI